MNERNAIVNKFTKPSVSHKCTSQITVTLLICRNQYLD